jgi:hypothetical protein
MFLLRAPWAPSALLVPAALPVALILRDCRPPEFESAGSSAGASQAADKLAALGLAESDFEEEVSPGGGSADAAQGGAAGAAAGAAEAGEQQAGEGEESGYSSEDGLPPIPRFNNRKVIEYAVSDTESDDE